MTIDLHTHSTASDGTYSPQELVQAAMHTGLTHVAITDHDTLAGIELAQTAASRLGSTTPVVIPGVEFSTESGTHNLHILGLFLDPKNLSLAELLQRNRARRAARVQEMVARLAQDFPITWEDILREADPQLPVGPDQGASVGRPHIADALIRAQVVPDRHSAFLQLLRPGTPYYVPQEYQDAAELIQFVTQLGGVCVLAHPCLGPEKFWVPRSLILELQKIGLAGVEADHPQQEPQVRQELKEFAIAHGLIYTGASDFHGVGKPNLLGQCRTTPEQYTKLLELLPATAQQQYAYR